MQSQPALNHFSSSSGWHVSDTAQANLLLDVPQVGVGGLLGQILCRLGLCIDNKQIIDYRGGITASKQSKYL